MSTRAAGWSAVLAWALGLAAIALDGTGLALYVSADATGVQSLISTPEVAVAIAGGLVGPVVASKRPGNPIGWIICAIALCGGLYVFAGQYAAQALVRRPGSLPGAAVVAWIAWWAWLPGFGLFISALLLLFPDGRLPSRRWRLVAWLEFGGLAALLGILMTFPENLEFRIDNPLGVEVVGRLEPFIPAVMPLFFLACMLASVSGVVVRFRRSRGVERQQLKWFASSAALIAVVNLIWEFVLDPASLTGSLLWMAAVMTSPAAIGVAVLRYRLYDIDRIVNRTVVYGLVTAMLAALYAAGVVAGQALLAPVTSEQQWAVAAATLVVAAVFGPLRRRVQAGVDRRFNRARYDAARTVERFSATLRDEVELDTLSSRLQLVVARTVEPAHVSLWLRTETQGQP